MIGDDYGPDYQQYDEYVDPIIDKLDQIHRYGHSRYDVFTDWLDLMLYMYQGRDDPYMEIVETYDTDRPEGDRAPDLYAKAIGDLYRGMEATQADLLGVVYETMGHHSDAFGQHFTPHPLCDLHVALSGLADEDDPQSVTDPTSGSGRMLVAAGKQHPQGLYYGVDKSAACAKMTALNLKFYTLNGYAVHADSLTQDYYAGWQTAQTVLGGKIQELDVADIPRPTFTTDEAAAETGDDHTKATRLRQASFDDFSDT